MTAAVVDQEVVVRRATSRDRTAVLALPGLAGTTRSRLAHELVAADRLAWVASREERVIGYAAFWRSPTEAHLLDLAVADDERRRGVATTLLCHGRDHLVASGTPRLTLEVRVGNVGARRLYDGLGFVAVGVRRGYYPPVPGSPPEDAVVAWWPDAPSDLPVEEVPPC